MILDWFLIRRNPGNVSRKLEKEEKLALIQRFAPVLKFTRGERFFPMTVEDYLRASSLWILGKNQEEKCLVPQGELDIEKLGTVCLPDSEAVQFLKFIEPVDFPELLEFLQTQIRQKDVQRFHPGKGRLARVGYVSRFVDLVFSLSLLARGRVSGDTSIAASLEYRRIFSENPQYTYYARVIKQEEWLVLQYWYFYAFNNWRSGFFGLNDHEADWEMVNIYLSEKDGDWQPEWVAYASHDFSGDDLRRHWFDPEIEKVGEHPIVYVGAGSHASYFQAGEYLMELDVPFLSPIYRVVEFLSRKLQGLVSVQSKNDGSQGKLLRIPFVDYARGDGLVVGYNQEIDWDHAVLLDPVPGWVKEYRGLWGLYAQDPTSGENAPSGPMYQRNGTLRKVWYDPLGWAGMDKVPTQPNLNQVINFQKNFLLAQQEELQGKVDQKSQQLIGEGVTFQALKHEPNLNRLAREAEKQIDGISSELAQFKTDLATNELRLASLDRYLIENQGNTPLYLRDHIKHAIKPTRSSEMRTGRFAEWWAAASVALMLFGFVLMLIFNRQHIVFGTSVMIALFVFIESSFRRTLPRLINSLAIGLAAAAGLLVLFHYFWYVVVFAIILTGIFILIENLRELL